MLSLNEEKVEAVKNDLQFHRGFVPFQFDGFINLTKRKRFLESVGLWREVHNKELEVMQGIRDNEPNDDVYMDKVLKEWIMQNPKFTDLVVFD